MRKIWLIILLGTACVNIHAPSFDEYEAQIQTEFDYYKLKQQREFKEYRNRINAEFAVFLEKTWEKKEGSNLTPREKTETFSFYGTSGRFRFDLDKKARLNGNTPDMAVVMTF